MNYKYYPSQDLKILTWNKENYEDLIHCFTDDELKEMCDYLHHHPIHPINYDFCLEYDEEKYLLVYEYICLLLVTIMNDSIALHDNEAQILIDAAIAMG